jgi:plastocyanin
MAQTWIIAINKVSHRKSGQPRATFKPESQTVAVGDIISWRNNDSVPHWPAPSVAGKTDWMDFQIPGKKKNQPAPTSQQALSFSAATTVTYVCALHPDETGTIIVA